MAIASIGTFTILLVLILPLAAGTALQYYLSGRPEKWPGLLLPALSFLFSCLSGAGMVLYMHAGAGVGAVIGSALIPFCLVNVPTLLFLVIYFLRRKKYCKRSEIEKMNIQDL